MAEVFFQLASKWSKWCAQTLHPFYQILKIFSGIPAHIVAPPSDEMTFRGNSDTVKISPDGKTEGLPARDTSSPGGLINSVTNDGRRCRHGQTEVWNSYCVSLGSCTRDHGVD